MVPATAAATGSGSGRTRNASWDSQQTLIARHYAKVSACGPQSGVTRPDGERVAGSSTEGSKQVVISSIP